MSIKKIETQRPQRVTPQEAPQAQKSTQKAKPAETKPQGWLPTVDVGQVVQTTQQKLTSGFSAAQKGVGQVVDQVRTTGSQVLDQAGRAWEGLKEKFGPVRQQAVDFLEQNMHRVREAAGQQRDTTGMATIRRGDIQIQVKPLEMNIPADKLSAELDRAMQEKAQDDAAAYGQVVKDAGFGSLEEWAKSTGYYGSDTHRAWAEAAEARTGGKIPAEFWMKFDPFGGTAGTGPKVLPQGQWPGAIASIAMGHDTDWSLGRYFGAGPMAALKGAPGSADALGMVGLAPSFIVGERFKNVPLYTDPRGMSDWVVKQVRTE